MKKLCSAAAVFAILAVMVLGAYTENRADGSALNFPNVEWGMTWEEVMTAAGIAEEDVLGDNAQGRFSSGYGVTEYEVFGQRADGVLFTMIDLGGGTQRLTTVMINYPDDADMDRVLQEMTKAYGSPVPELINYDIFSSIDSSGEAKSLYSKQYAESEKMKIWAGSPLNEVVPKEQEQAYMKTWQEKIYSQESSISFQRGLTDDQWDEFTKNARMAMVLWMNEADEHKGGNRVYLNAYIDQAFDEITRRISEQ